MCCARLPSFQLARPIPPSHVPRIGVVVQITKIGYEILTKHPHKPLGVLLHHEGFLYEDPLGDPPGMVRGGRLRPVARRG